jgi:hypothetical protein
MSRWSELFRKLSEGVTDGDTCDTCIENVETTSSRTTITTELSQVSPSVNGVTLELAPPTEPIQSEPSVSNHGDAGNFAEVVFCDFETRNVGGCDLAKVGAWRYAADIATEIVCFGYRVDYEDRWWTPAGGSRSRLMVLAANPTRHFACFAGFEPVVWQLNMVERHGFPPISTERWTDVRAVCSYLALPRKLEKVLPVLGLSVTKDVAGQRFIKSLSRPNRKGDYPVLTEAVLRRVVEYNRSDLRALEALYGALAGDLNEPTP